MVFPGYSVARMAYHVYIRGTIEFPLDFLIIPLLHFVTGTRMVYVPRKCSATGRLIGSKDHASVQFNIGHVNEAGVYTRSSTAVALSGYVRKCGLADGAVNRIAADAGLMKALNTFAVAEDVVAAPKKD
jgi:small subunit ribosomal protein S21e